MSHSWDLPSTAETESKPPFIVFGYGSLIFKPPPHVVAQVPGFLRGYVRRFAQKSHDHRGTPEVRSILDTAEAYSPSHRSQNPGRVVTLIHKEDWDAFSDSDPFPDEDVVWGIAYTIDPVYEAEVRDYLDYREKDGYTMETLDVYGVNEQTGQETVLLHGVYEYLYNLVRAVRKLAPESHDSHLQESESWMQVAEADLLASQRAIIYLNLKLKNVP
ncbi:cation transport regulator-like protein [Moniliophthora roreri]|nr:cation transport regulator-like protein [Moniliophthora roreri]